MTRICLALCACVLLLGGCMHTTKAEFTRHYALGSTAQAIPENREPTHPGEKILQIARIAVPEWLEGTAMFYRLDYQHNGRLSAYGRSDWIAPPATLLEPVVQSTIAAGRSWRAVIGPGNPANADFSLHVRLDDFSQTFSQPSESTGVIDATATLIDNRDDSVVAQKHFHVEVPTAAPDAQGGTKALEQASKRFAMRLQRWLKTAADAQAQENGGN